MSMSPKKAVRWWSSRFRERGAVIEEVVQNGHIILIGTLPNGEPFEFRFPCTPRQEVHPRDMLKFNRLFR